MTKPNYLALDKYKLTKHCCRCNKIALADGTWLPAILVRIRGIKESHGFCPECLAWQMRLIEERRREKC